MAKRYTIVSKSFHRNTSLGALFTNPCDVLCPEPALSATSTNYVKAEEIAASSIAGLFDKEDGSRDKISQSNITSHVLLKRQEYIDLICDDDTAVDWIDRRVGVGQQIFLVYCLITIKPDCLLDRPPVEPSIAPQILRHGGEMVIGIKYEPVMSPAEHQHITGQTHQYAQRNPGG